MIPFESLYISVTMATAETGRQIWRAFLWAWLIGPLLPAVDGCRVARGAECDKAPFVPGHNLAGEGFDVVRMRRTGAYVINVKAHLSDNSTCTLCPNRFHAGQVRRVGQIQMDTVNMNTVLSPWMCSHLFSTDLHSVHLRLGPFHFLPPPLENLI